MKTYNGHKNWAHWNVSLWVNNEEPMYRLALDCIEATPNRERAAKMMLDCLLSAKINKTPDGARYSLSSIKAAMRGME